MMVLPKNSHPSKKSTKKPPRCGEALTNKMAKSCYVMEVKSNAVINASGRAS